MDLSTWLLFLVTETALCLTPGPAVVYVFSQGLGRGVKSSLAANLGIVTGNTIYFALSATGLGALVLTSHELFLVLKWAGAAYLIWLGFGALLGRAGSLSNSSAAPSPARRLFRGGMIVQLANPKNLVFFMAILPQFIDPGGHILLQMVILGITSQVIEFVVLACYGSMAASARGWARTPRFARWADRIAGSLLVSIGASLAFVRRADA